MPVFEPMELFTWLIVTTILYHYFGYPVLLHRLATVRTRPAARQVIVESTHQGLALPTVTIIVPAHNESAFITPKIINLFTLNYPLELLKIVVALDGCTDDTKRLAAIAIESAPPQLSIELVEYRQNMGKVNVLNEQIARTSSDIIALTDASAILEPDCLRKAALHFANRTVGVVCATYALAETGSEGERRYWIYQTRIKADEAALAAPMGAHGAFYLIRRDLWSPLPPDTINDDFVTPMRIVAAGYNAVYDRTIVATELERSEASQEFRRRMRISAGNTQQLFRLIGLGNFRHARLAFVFLSGKGLRVLMPYLIVAALAAVTAMGVQGRTLYKLISVAIILAMSVAYLANIGRDEDMPSIVAKFAYFVRGNLASLLGSAAYVAGAYNKAWQPARSSSRAHARSRLDHWKEFVARVFECICALILLTAMAFVFLPLAIVIKLSSPGSVFSKRLCWRQSASGEMVCKEVLSFRCARDGENYRMTGGPPRLTYIGWFLQLIWLEDLPQYSVALLGKVLVGSERKPSSVEHRPFMRDLFEEVLPPRVVKAKRLADVLCAVAGLTVLAVVFIPIALAIKVDSNGPVFYRQRRVGRSLGVSTALFDIIKFRTMHDSAELKSGPVWATKHDSRVTRVGRFLRNTRLDELPQFINVLRGDMSIVGPRPERPKFVDQLQKAIPFYTERLYGLRPGITGLAQVNQSYDTSIDDVRRKVAFDHAYALQLGSMISWMRADAVIMLKTISVVLGRKGL